MKDNGSGKEVKGKGKKKLNLKGSEKTDEKNVWVRQKKKTGSKMKRCERQTRKMGKERKQ